MKILFESENNRLEIGLDKDDNLTFEISDGMMGTGLVFDPEEAKLLRKRIDNCVDQMEENQRSKMKWWKRILS